MKKGKNIADIQKMNRSLVIRTIQKQKSTTRAEISKLTDLNQATVTNIVGDLISWGVVKETGLIAGRSGRRSIKIELATENYAIIGVRLTRRHFIVGVFDLYGECRCSERFSVGLTSPIEELLDKMVAQIRQKSSMCRGQSVLGITLALPGPYIKRKGEIALLTGRQEWQRVDIADRLRRETGFSVITEQDANAAVMAEWCSTQNYDETASIVSIMVGQGVGAGVIENGKLVTGSLGIAGEIGHMSIQYNGRRCECGNYGCLEQYCSTLAVQRQIKELLHKYPETVCTEDSNIEDIIRAYLEGDCLAVSVIDDAARFLGYGIANIVNVLNPQRIFIGDELSKAGDRFLNIVKESVKERILPELYDNMEIVISQLNDSVLRGACMLLMKEMVREPEILICKEQQPEDWDDR